MRPKNIVQNFAFWLTLIVVFASFIFGGGSRSDIVSLIFLRPIAAAALVLGLFYVDRRLFLDHKMVFAGLVGLGAIAVVQMIPLPAAIWEALPARDLVSEIDRAVGLSSSWRPISLNPGGTLNALMALMVPLALLVALTGVNEREFRLIFLIFIGFLLASAALGILQVAGSGDSIFYLYRITNHGFSVGLFSNRNHQAIALACLFPMLAAYASLPSKSAELARIKFWLSLLAGAAIVPLILVTGSRLGVGLAFLGLLSVRWIYRPAGSTASKIRTSKKANKTPFILAGALMLVVAIMVVMTRISVVSRFNSESSALDDIRFKVWAPVLEMVRDFFPFGAGLGSFVEVYKVYEPEDLLSPRYLNHAHNDILELLFEAGLFGLVLLVVGIVFLGRSAITLLRSRSDGPELAMGKAGLAIIIFLSAASLVDYPLRTPSLACMFIFGTVCMRRPLGQTR